MSISCPTAGSKYVHFISTCDVLQYTVVGVHVLVCIVLRNDCKTVKAYIHFLVTRDKDKVFILYTLLNADAHAFVPDKLLVLRSCRCYVAKKPLSTSLAKSHDSTTVIHHLTVVPPRRGNGSFHLNHRPTQSLISTVYTPL